MMISKCCNVFVGCLVNVGWFVRMGFSSVMSLLGLVDRLWVGFSVLRWLGMFMCGNYFS